MGMYDIYGDFGIQLKVGDVEMNHYRLGQKVSVDDGIYLAPDGVVVVKDGIFVVDFQHPCLWSKWGDALNIEKIIGGMNPVEEALRSFVKSKIEK